jgi:hypothetical protein
LNVRFRALFGHQRIARATSALPYLPSHAEIIFL